MAKKNVLSGMSNTKQESTKKVPFKAPFAKGKKTSKGKC